MNISTFLVTGILAISLFSIAKAGCTESFKPTLTTTNAPAANPAASLNLTKKQAEAFQQFQKEFAGKTMEIVGDKTLSPTEKTKNLQALNAERKAVLAKILTTQQLQTLEEIRVRSINNARTNAPA